jgi:hypothetical protein
MPTPVFTLGSPRNGTTWLSNILGSHPSVSAIQHEAHWGAHENNLYTNWRYWNHFEDLNAFIKFIELYASADYFRLSAVEDKYEFLPPPDDFLEFYLDLMDAHASKNETPYWTTKLDPLIYPYPSTLRRLFRRIEDRYGSAKFVAVKRPLPDVLRSYLHMQGRAHQHRTQSGVREAALVLQTARYVSHYTRIESILSGHGGLSLRFADLVDHRRDAVTRITDYLDLPSSNAMMEDPFPSNSSFRGRSPEPSIPGWELSLCTRGLQPLFSQIPSVAHRLLRLRDALRDDPAPILYWRLLKYSRMPDQLEEELETRGQVGLLRVLFPHRPP